MLEKALRGARLLFAYTIFIEAPVEEVFRFTGNPDYWTRTFEGDPNPQLELTWEGRRYQPGSTMTLGALRKDGTSTPIGAIQMELIHYTQNEEITYRYLSGNHLIYRFVYEKASPTRTEFTVNVLVDAQSSRINNLVQRVYAKRRRKDSIAGHLKVKSILEQRARAKR